MMNFASDNYSPAHPKVLDWIKKANEGLAAAYGKDQFTADAQAEFKKHFGNQSEAFFVWNGTAANVLGLSQVLKSHESVLCSDLSHIAVDECGAPEKHTGAKLIPVSTPDGKLTPALLAPYFSRAGDVHSSQPRVLSITQATEYGTVYSIEELKALTQFAHSKNLLIHMDGARISNAAVSLDVNFKQMTTDVGIDLVSFGGTKNGLLGAEAIVFTDGSLAKDFPYARKQGLHLASKMRFISAQFLAYFENDLWKSNAQNSNRMAALLAEKLNQLGVSVHQKTQANGVFATLTPDAIQTLKKEFHFYVWNESKNEVRLMCSFNTSEAEIEAFAQALSKNIKIREF